MLRFAKSQKLGPAGPQIPPSGMILDAALSMRLFPKTLNVARKKASYRVCSIFLFKGT
jgi:hypothetical protein